MLIKDSTSLVGNEIDKKKFQKIWCCLRFPSMGWWTHKKRKTDGTKHLQNNIAFSESHRVSVVKNQLYFIYKNVILTVQSKNVKSTLQYAPGHWVYFRSPTSPAPTLFSLSETDLVALRNRLRGAWKGLVLILITCIRKLVSSTYRQHLVDRVGHLLRYLDQRLRDEVEMVTLISVLVRFADGVEKGFSLKKIQ